MAPALSDLLDLLPPVAVQYQETEPPQSPVMAPLELQQPLEPLGITVLSPITPALPVYVKLGETQDLPTVAVDRLQPPIE